MPPWVGDERRPPREPRTSAAASWGPFIIVSDLFSGPLSLSLIPLVPEAEPAPGLVRQLFTAD